MYRFFSHHIHFLQSSERKCVEIDLNKILFSQFVTKHMFCSTETNKKSSLVYSKSFFPHYSYQVSAHYSTTFCNSVDLSVILKTIYLL